MSDKRKKCSLCYNDTEEGDAILVMGPLGNPRCVCKECESQLDTATLGRSYEEISAAMNAIGKKLTEKAPDDLVLETVNTVLKNAAERAELIKEGNYDFSLDEEIIDEQELEEIPDELLETEEDRLRDAADEKKQAKFDKIFNIVAAIVILAVVGFIAYKYISGLL